MGFRKASGTKPSMLASQVPTKEEQIGIQEEVVSSTPKGKIQSSSRTPAMEDFSEEVTLEDATDMGEFDFMNMPLGGVEPTASTTPMPEPTVQAQPTTETVTTETDILNTPMPVRAEGKTKNYLFDLQESKEPFEGSVAGIQFKRDDMGQYYYLQKNPSKPGYKTTGKPSEFGMPYDQTKIEEAGWKPVSQMDGATRNYLNVASSVMLDAPEIATSLAAGLAVGAVTGGIGFFPALLAEMAAGGVGGYLGGSLAQDKYKQMIQNKDDAKQLAFLEAALSSPQQPTSPLMAGAFGAAGGLIPASMLGLGKAYQGAVRTYAQVMKRARPYIASALDEVANFADKIGVDLTAVDVAKNIDPDIAQQASLIESGRLPGQAKLINNTEGKKVKLAGFIDVMRKKFNPSDETIGKLTAKETAESPFAEKVMLPREDQNLIDVVENNHKVTLSNNRVEALEMAMDARFKADGLMANIESLFEQSFDSFRRLREQGFTGAELLNQFELTQPKEAAILAKFYNNARNMSEPLVALTNPKTGNVVLSKGPRQLSDTSDFKFIDTEFDAIPAERFENKVIQEQLSTIRKPIEPQPIGGGPEYQAEGFQFVGPDGKVQSDNYVGFGRPPYTDPTTGKTLYGRGDLPDRAYYVTGGPAGVPGAPMPQLGQLTESGSRLPGGVSASRVPVGDQVQESLFGVPVGSAAGPQGIESPAKQFLGPKRGGKPSQGLTFRQLTELNDQAQAMVKQLEGSSKDSRLIGIAKQLAETTRQFEDDSIFKLGVVRGNEAFAEKVVLDKRKYANAVQDITDFRAIFDAQKNNIGGAVLNLKPEQTRRLMSYLSDDQKQELGKIIFDRAYNDSVSSVLEKSGVGMSVDPSKVAKSMLEKPETRENIKYLFGDEALQDLDNWVKLTNFLNKNPEYKAAPETIGKALSRYVRWMPGGAKIDDFLSAFLYGNPRAQQLLKTQLDQIKTIIRKPSGGIIGKAQKASFRTMKSPVKRAAISAGVKMIPQTGRMLPSRYKTQEEINQDLTFGELEQ
jgi:hypothetical protein